MPRSRWLPVLFILGMASSGLVGCGRGAPDTRAELRFCFFGGYEEWKLWQRIAKAFESQNTDLRLKLLYWPGLNYEDKVKLVMAAGTAPDVLSLQDEPFPAYSRLRQFEDLSPYLARHPD